MDKSQEILEKAPSKGCSEAYSAFLKQLEGLEKVEDKLKCSIDFMRSTLSKEKIPAFRDFWDAKKLCLSFFKENIPSRMRNLFWKDYVALSDEIRKIKEILDEKSSFAYEQIDLVIQALEKDLQEFDTSIAAMHPLEVPKEAKYLKENQAAYQERQNTLTRLNILGAQIHALRKELVDTPMRMRKKNEQFDKLSKLGDQVFPRRKELMKSVAELFLADIDRFVEAFCLDYPPFFALKEEIRAMQGFAKVLTLNSASFSRSRKLLSGCWDQIKEKESKYREKRSSEKNRFKENFDQIAPKIQALKEECAAYAISLEGANQKIDAILKEMRELELGKDEIKRLKKHLFETRKPLEEKQEQDRIKQKEAEALASKKQMEAQGALSDQMLEVLNQAKGLALTTLVEKWESLVKEEKALFVEGHGIDLLANRLSWIADHIQEKKWQALLDENPQDLIDSLNVILEERKKERLNLKEKTDVHRKIAGGSGLSFEQSLLYQELIEEEKTRLDSIELMIEEIEEKLFDLEE